MSFSIKDLLNLKKKIYEVDRLTFEQRHEIEGIIDDMILSTVDQGFCPTTPIYRGEEIKRSLEMDFNTITCGVS